MQHLEIDGSLQVPTQLIDETNRQEQVAGLHGRYSFFGSTTVLWVFAGEWLSVEGVRGRHR